MRTHYYINIAIVLSCLIILMACTSKVKEELRIAENLVITAPDSALTILENIRQEAVDNVSVRPQYELIWAEAYYIRNRKLPDSIDKTLATLDTSSSTKMDIMKRIMQSISLLEKGRVEDAFSIFEICSREMNDEIAPYWKCLVEDYLGIIYLNSGLNMQARKHFFNVLELSESMGGQKNIAKAYSHISCYYHMVNELDSALHYATLVLENENLLDSQMVAIAYQNLYNIQMSITGSREIDDMGIIKLYNRHRLNTSDSILTYALITQAYYLAGHADSAFVFQQKVERGNHNNAKLVMYKFLSDYYQRHELTDSAFKYLKLYNRMDSINARTKSVEPLLNIVYMHNQNDAEKQSHRQKAMIAIISIIVILVIVILLRVKHKRRMTTAYDEIEHQNIQIHVLDKQKEQLSDDLKASREESLKLHDKVSEQKKTIESVESDKRVFKEELNSTQKVLQDTQSELRQTTDILSMAHRKIENYQALINKKNSRLAQAQRDIEKSNANKKDQSHTIIHNFLDKSTYQNDKMNKTQMQYIIDSYMASTTDRYDFMRSLMRKSDGLTATGKIICILYHEGFSDEEIISKLHYDSNNFRTAKSRARTSIDLINNADSPIIKDLLRRFDYKKSGG